MPNDDQDHYARISAEIGDVSVEVEGNHSLAEVEASFHEQLAKVCAKAEQADSNTGGAIQ